MSFARGGIGAAFPSRNKDIAMERRRNGCKEQISEFATSVANKNSSLTFVRGAFTRVRDNPSVR